MALGLRALADLLDAGMSMTRTLQTLAELAPASWRDVIPHLAQSVREGKTLGAALRDAPVEIPALVVGLTLAGERAGDLPSAVRRAADITEAASETRAALRAALAYPALLAVAGTGTIALMVAVVIPRFAAILGDMGQTLPPATRMLLDAAAMARAAWAPALLGLAACALVARAVIASDGGRLAWDELLMRLPVGGSIRHASATARVSVTLATLLETGVSLRQALPFAAEAGGNAAVADRIRGAATQIDAGNPIAASLAEQRALTPLALRLTQAGEESGRLPAMLRHAARLEQARADRTLRTLVRMVEPGLVLVFAGIVTSVAVALLQAVYSVRPTP